VSNTHNSMDSGKTQADVVAEQLFELFHSDADVHFEQSKFLHINSEGKHVFDKKGTYPPAVSVELIQAHLRGDIRLAVIPLLKNDTAKWGGADIDIYDGSINVVDLCDRIAALPLPLYFGYSKSGGGHIYLFCEETISASTLRKCLQAVVKNLGVKAEAVFPKQDTGKFGNALELPYCGMKYEGSINTCILTAIGNSMTLEHFLGSVKKPQ
jgi:hypothetical protein